MAAKSVIDAQAWLRTSRLGPKELPDLASVQGEVVAGAAAEGQENQRRKGAGTSEFGRITAGLATSPPAFEAALAGDDLVALASAFAEYRRDLRGDVLRWRRLDRPLEPPHQAARRLLRSVLHP